MSEIRRLKKKVNRLIAQRKLAETQRDSAREERDDLIANSNNVDIDVIAEAITLLRMEHDQIHHAGTCNSCRALAIFEQQYNIPYFPWNPEGWKKVNGTG